MDCHRFSGFTILQSLLVIVVLALIAMTASLLLPSSQPFQSEGFAGILMHDIQLTRVISMSQNQRYRIVVGASSYQIQNQSSTPINNPETGATSTLFPSGVTVTPATTIIFDGLGRPYDGASIALSSTVTFTVTSGSSSTQVNVIPQTGFVE
jgi:type II secretory pathway pseudopilin PulG